VIPASAPATPMTAGMPSAFAAPQQFLNHPHLDGVEISETLAQAGRTRPEGAELQCPEFVGRLSAELILADQSFDRRQKLLILGHQDLGVEDAGFLRTGPLKYPLAQVLQVGDDVFDRLPQPPYLAFHLVGRDGAVGHLREIPAHHQRGGTGYSR
jgi:hypothetical protein